MPPFMNHPVRKISREEALAIAAKIDAALSALAARTGQPRIKYTPVTLLDSDDESPDYTTGYCL